MKKITCIQQYVIDNLIEDKILTSNSLLGAVSKVCSKEYVDGCIGKYSTLPNIILQTEVDEVTKKLEPYNVIVSTAVFY